MNGLSYHRQHGRSSFANLIILAIVALVIYSAIKIIPVYVNAYQLIDYADEIAKYPGYRTVDAIKNQIFDKARELGISLDRRNIEVRLTDRETKIHLSFDIEVNIITYKYRKHFDETMTYPRF